MAIRPTARDLTRLALTPKWLGLAVAVIAFIALAGTAGQWQWTRTQDIIAAEKSAQAAPVPVETIAAADEPLPAAQIGRPVTATGRYLPDGQIAVLHRSWRDEPGIWVVTPLELGDGTRVAVLRGWLPNDQAPGMTPPAGEVQVTGIMHPDERFYADAVNAPGTDVSISSARLAKQWGPGTRSGFVNLVSEQPPSVEAPRPVPAMVDASDVGFPLRNFGYALQWFVFAVFGLVVYGRWLWLDACRNLEEQATSSGSMN